MTLLFFFVLIFFQSFLAECRLLKWKTKERVKVYPRGVYTGKNNRWFPFLDILEYLKNSHKNPKFGRVRQVPTRELGWDFPGWDLSHFAIFGIFMDIL